MKRLNEEERKSKDMLDLRITADHAMELAIEDAEAMLKRKLFNRDDIINKQVQFSKLKQQKKRLIEELAEVETQNSTLIMENEKYEVDNEKL